MPEMPSFKLNALRRSKGHSDTRLEAATTHFSKMVIKFTTNKIIIRNGPGCIIGQEGKSVLVKHGGEYVRVHPASLVHADEANPTTKSEGSEPIPIVEQCELTPIVKEEEEICKQDYSGIVEREKRTNIASDQ